MIIYKCEKSDKNDAEKYELKNGEQVIGFAYYFGTEINPIEIYVNENERSNGYGKLLFAKMLEVAKEKGAKSLFFQIEDNNYIVSNIVSSAGAIHLSSTDGITKWVLPII